MKCIRCGRDVSGLAFDTHSFTTAGEALCVGCESANVNYGPHRSRGDAIFRGPEGMVQDANGRWRFAHPAHPITDDHSNAS